MSIPLNGVTVAGQTLKSTTVGGEEVQHGRELPGTAAAVSTVAQNAGSVELLAANANRLRAKIFNDPDSGGAALYLRYGAGAATADDWTDVLASGGSHHVEGYTGAIQGIWSGAGSGKARITEVTP